ncbi:protein-serine O-palmitoleoyltransferase porcupine-like [Penaeus monodon]|uniref:protein-serine O-palmitoleoyltransferase porcupine-like n=1 Tax=Penaeus monodon TaxID=6687 RepID=UPI0018A77F2E|nr:protein-serine O-palmitoleoyltransferase porcupine-like [Penaeus monodon]XP_037782494.1 protein-serine O-palmitoleoyltransferase porcupine-like [Penaeus monodon]
MDDFMYGDYDYDPNAEDVEYLDYYDDEIYEIPEDEPWEDDDDLESQFTISELYEYCVVPTVTDSARHLYNILMWSLIFSISTRFVRVPACLVHLMSAACGCVVAWQLFGQRTVYMATLTAVGGLSLLTSNALVKARRGPWTCVACVVVMTVCELWWADPVDWHSIRGAQMIILMKVVSVGYDLDAHTLTACPGLAELLGYILNPGSIIFGPWVSFKTYMKVLEPASWKTWPILRILQSLAASLLFLIKSTCIISWILADPGNKWMLAYRDALAFRTSHYFVSYMSEVSALLAGLEIAGVANPGSIEVPRSLGEVVVFWNMPMHHWLKTYVFKPVRGQLGVFWALLFTYSMSALFHGLNFQLAAVLLSLGFYTYVEHSLRYKLSSAFDACILARPCPESCEHTQKGWSVFTICTNLAFGLLAMFHLAYLGIMFDSSPQQQESGYSMKHTLTKWSILDYASHWVVLVCYIVNAVI